MAIFFQDNFETGDLNHTENGAGWGSQTNIAVNTTSPKTGTYAVEFFFEGTDPADDSWSELAFDLGDNYPEIWVSYDMLIPSNYYHRTTGGSNNNKGWLYAWDGDYGSPSGPGLGPNFWPDGDGTSNASIYSWGPSIDKHYWSACPDVINANDYGKWVHIVAHYKYATIANDDGIAEIWKTTAGESRVKMCDVQDGTWYASGQPGFDQGYILGWANSGFDDDTYFYMDNVKFSTTSLLEEEVLQSSGVNVGENVGENVGVQ